MRTGADNTQGRCMTYIVVLRLFYRKIDEYDFRTEQGTMHCLAAGKNLRKSVIIMSLVCSEIKKMMFA